MAKSTVSEANANKAAALKKALEMIRKDFGAESIMTLGESKTVDIETYSSGSIALDNAIGGGYAKGRIIEIYGPESSGKTSLALHAIAEVQKSGGIAAFIDAEHALDPVYAAKIGVKTKDLLFSQPDNGEQALEILDALVRSGTVGMIVVDSVAALVPKSEIEGAMGDSTMGVQARLMSQALRKVTAAAQKSGTTIIFINQLRMKIGVMFGNPETTTGGNALKFYASTRLDIRRKDKIEDKNSTKEDKDIIGNKAHIKVVKNKIAAPFKECDVNIMYNMGIDRVAELLELGVETEVLKKSGSHLSYGDVKLGAGKDAASAFLRENEKVAEKIGAEIRVALKKTNVVKDEVVSEDGEEPSEDAE